MKSYYKCFTAIVFIALGFNGFSQGVGLGNIIIDPYYGYPNFGKSYAQAVEDANTSGVDFKAGGIGPAGLRIEYMVADRIGLGADVIYNSNVVSFSSVDSVYNGTTDTWSTETNSYEYKMQRVRAQLRINYHFNITSPDFDSYIGVGAGTNNRFRTTTENGVEVEGNGLDDFTLLPFSIRLCAGARYYFSDNFGINTEIGIGGPVISLGLSVKI